MNKEHHIPTVSIEMAGRLRDAGLVWNPREGDRFHIPDRDLGDQVWSISDMVIEERSDILGRRELAFNGAVEWALDSIVTNEVVWIPSEGQLRALLGDDFIALTKEEGDRYACVIRMRGIPKSFLSDTAPDAYAAALLATLE